MFSSIVPQPYPVSMNVSFSFHSSVHSYYLTCFPWHVQQIDTLCFLQRLQRIAYVMFFTSCEGFFNYAFYSIFSCGNCILQPHSPWGFMLLWEIFVSYNIFWSCFSIPQLFLAPPHLLIAQLRVIYLSPPSAPAKPKTSVLQRSVAECISYTLGQGEIGQQKNSNPCFAPLNFLFHFFFWFFVLLIFCLFVLIFIFCEESYYLIFKSVSWPSMLWNICTPCEDILLWLV